MTNAVKPAATSENSVQRIAEILIQVSDAERSLRFYRTGLGLRFDPTGYGDGSFEAKVGEVRLLLHPDFDDALRNIKRGAGVLIHLWVPDADAYCEQVRRRGIPVLDEPEDRPWGRHFSVIDPDGYRIDVLGPLSRTPASTAG
jgi:predicted enzyme related to lactoylglutathione lyase